VIPRTSSSGENPAATPPSAIESIHAGVGCLVMGCGVSLVFALLTLAVWIARGRL
jgi:hypothetical protein